MTKPQQDLTFRLLIIKNPFLLVRFVAFSLLLFMMFTALVSAAWNVGASRATGVHVDGASAFVIFNSIATTLLIAVAWGDLALTPTFSSSAMGFECAWTGIFATLQIAASIYITLSGPPEYCKAKTPLSVCASITLLVPVTWLSAMTLLAYWIAVMTLCITHLRLHDQLWRTPIYAVTWFSEDGTAASRDEAPQLPPLDTSTSARLSVVPPRRHSISSFPQDVERQNPVDREKPLPSPGQPSAWYTRLLPGRPGKDHPFAFRRTKAPEFQWWVPPAQGDGENPSPKLRPVPAAGDSEPPPLAALPPAREAELDEDKPIPAGSRSQWVRAAQAPGPYSPPPPKNVYLNSWRS
ncbi:hypothetical protein BC834DRAFT_966164 [Gloeopeniophorella convolvens]|nr:hypothetical protein BC834DRAFT_966164 [Gloeopeniophorella convolvens]